MRFEKDGNRLTIFLFDYPAHAHLEAPASVRGNARFQGSDQCDLRRNGLRRNGLLLSIGAALDDPTIAVKFAVRNSTRDGAH